MCGLAGFIGSSGPAISREAAVRRMAGAIRHRGPDDSGIWVDDNAGIALGHRRLAIIDLTPAGHQPMVSASGRYIIAFNGEIYNFEELRKQLAGEGKAPVWRGHSDTEVFLEAIAAWGLRTALDRAAGMFAFAVYDRETSKLTLVRDRLGEKPLYFGVNNGVLLFGSDLAALKAHPLWQGEVDRDALTLLLRYNNIPAPFSIYKGVAKVEPGTVLEFAAGNFVPVKSVYWDPLKTALEGHAAPFRGNAEDAADEVERLLRQSIAGQMISDVPLGAFLSGGIDSTTVTALMQTMSKNPVKSFSIGFEEPGFDEAPHAKTVARHLGTDHTELYVSKAEALAAVPRLASVYSEPFADPSQLPTLLLSELARRHVTVALSGDGGDELFSGYNRYDVAHRRWRQISRVPHALRSALAAGIRAQGAERIDRAARLFPKKIRPPRAGEKLLKAAAVAGERSIEAVYQRLISNWQDPQAAVIGAREPPIGLNWQDLSALPPVRAMMLCDLVNYLPGDVLAKVDRAAMSCGIETRVPMLDHHLAAFAASLPVEILRLGGRSKWPLRRILSRYVPDHIIERPKMGFGVPLDAWLRGPLRDWAENLLDERRLDGEGYFLPAIIREAWRDHQSGRHNMGAELWIILMFEAWLDNEKAKAS